MEFKFLLIFLFSFIISHFLVGKIRSIVIFKRLMKNSNHRSSHTGFVPNLGGVAFYIVLMFSFYFIKPYDKNDLTTALLPALTILLFTGIKDDIIVISAITKFIAQIISALFYVLYVLPKLNLYGFLGLEVLPLWLSGIISVLIIITVINTINLIDGIDGLAAIISIIILTTYGVFFFLTKENFMFLLCLSLIGCLLAFLRYNFSLKNKIFMGDTGSMILGFIIGFFTIQILSLKNYSFICDTTFKVENNPLLVLFILFIPLFDTIRVFITRTINKKSPFKPDRNHIHHIFIDYYKFSHKKVSLIIGLFNIFLITSSIILSLYCKTYILFLYLFLCIIFFTIYFYFLRKKVYMRYLRFKKNKIIRQKKISLHKYNLF